jgi:Prolyl oligopeptidase, N-terminal beta-propeller domain.
MRKVYFFAILLCLNFGNIFSQKNFNPPATKQIPVVDSLFGYIITDPYRWLEDKANPEVKEWSVKQTNMQGSGLL